MLGIRGAMTDGGLRLWGECRPRGVYLLPPATAQDSISLILSFSLLCSASAISFSFFSFPSPISFHNIFATIFLGLFLYPKTTYCMYSSYLLDCWLNCNLLIVNYYSVFLTLLNLVVALFSYLYVIFENNKDLFASKVILKAMFFF